MENNLPPKYPHPNSHYQPLTTKAFIEIDWFATIVAKECYLSDLKERIILLIGGAVIFVGMILSFFNAVTANPEAFAIVSLLGGGIIGHLFLKGGGVWNPKSDGYPPYKSVLIVLGVCVPIS